MMQKSRWIILLTGIGMLLLVETGKAQQQQGGQNFIRVAELGQLVDSVNVWGDISRAGRYLIPEGTTVQEMISLGMGYNTIRGREAELDWSKVIVEVKVSRLEQSQRRMDTTYFRYRFHDPEPVEMFDFRLQNNDIITVQVRRRPGFIDYLRVVGPILGTLGTSIVLYERLR